MRNLSKIVAALIIAAVFTTKTASAQLPGSLVPIVLLKTATGYWGANDDTDGDGVKNDVDPCPNRWGKMNGCPWSDKDGDGLSDIEDGCPEIAGKTELNGCPDKDADGVADKDDACPDVKGLVALGGCPDGDGDGIADKDDTCPTEKGSKELNGCPDGDGDGVADKDDACPKVAGLVANKGCPAVKEAVLKTFEKALNGIKFSSGRDRITSSSYKVLGEVVKIMEENPNYNLKINGHTDSSGDDAKNLVLSQKRAAAVQKYLVKKGVAETRLSSEGFGETIPVADNKTSKGRATNRRVELKVEFTKLVK